MKTTLRRLMGWSRPHRPAHQPASVVEERLSARLARRARSTRVSDGATTGAAGTPVAATPTGVTPHT